jgi:hypothetical protein
MSLATLETRIAALEARLTALEGSKPVKKVKAEPEEPKAKKEANWFVKALSSVRATLKPLIEAHNAALPEGGKKLAGTVAPQVGRMLKEAGQLSATVEPTQAQVAEAFKNFLISPPVPKTPDSGSAASGGGGAAAKAPKAELSEEEAAAKRSQKAAKAAATRAANKAAKAAAEAEPEAAAEAAPEAAPEAETVEEYEWEGDIGKGIKDYARIDYNDMSYIYTADGDTFLGEMNPKTNAFKKGGYDIKNT